MTSVWTSSSSAPSKNAGVRELRADRVERVDDLRALGSGQNADAFERAREGLRAANVGIGQAGDRSAAMPEKRSKTSEGLRSKRAAPELHTRLLARLSLRVEARTWIGRPIRLMKPRASFWSYSAPMVKLAILSE